MTAKRFRVTIGNENDVRFVDSVDNRHFLTISFKDYKDAVDCRDALLYQCNMMNELHEENQSLLRKNGAMEEEIECLSEENEQLKKQLESEHTMLDNAILLERTRMGQNSLKQYKEAIQ